MRLLRPVTMGLSLLAMTTPCLHAAETSSISLNAEESLKQKRSSWSQLNYYSPTEGFHSKGSFGLHLGIGAIAPEGTSGREHLNADERTNQKETRPRFYISKGTAWPIDFGAAFSLLQGYKKAMQGGAHIQWTIFEGFQLPSVALRASRSVLSNFQEVKNLTTDSAELGISYGIIRYVILSAAIRQQWEKGSTQAVGDYLSLTASELPDWSANRTVYSWGINISPFTPFIQVGLEQSYWDNQTQVSIAKVSFLL